MSPGDISVDIVTPATAAWLDRVDDDVFDHPVQPGLLAEFLSSPSNVLVVARWRDRVIGMATGLAYVHPDKARALFINEVGVSARHHRQGIGRRLVATLLAWGRRHGCVEAWVATGAGNTAARALYAASGGIEDDEAAVVYVYPLDSDDPVA